MGSLAFGSVAPHDDSRHTRSYVHADGDESIAGAKTFSTQADFAQGAEQRFYNTAPGDNYERGYTRWSSNVWTLGTEHGGSGTARGVRLSAEDNLFLRTAGIDALSIDPAQVVTLAHPLALTQTVAQVVSVTGTTNRVSLGGSGSAPVVDISTAYVGQSSVTTLGTIVTGVWHGTVVAALYGGTGLSTYAVGDMLYASATTPILSRLAAVATGSVLISQGTNTAPAWASSFSAGTITATIAGNATTATTLQTARAINGVNFDGSAAITVAAAAGTLTGATLASGVTASSLTSVGTIVTGTWHGSVIAGLYGGTGLSTAAVGDLLYASATTPTWSRLAAVATGSVLVSAGTNTAPSWSASPTLTNVTVNQTLNVGGAYQSNGTPGVSGAGAVSAITVTNGIVTAFTGVGTTGSGSVVLQTNASLINPTVSSGTLSLANALAALYGGTGLSTYAVGDLVYASATTPTLARLAAVATGSVLVSAGTNTAPSWATNFSAGTITAALSGNATTATTLATARAINGVNFNGSADITIAAAANTLTGTTLAAGVIASSLTSVGTIATGVWQGAAVAGLYGGTGLNTAAVGDLLYASATTPTWARLAAVTTGSILVSAGTNTAPVWSNSPAVGARGWLESLIPSTESVSQFIAIRTNGNGFGVLGAGRTSDVTFSGTNVFGVGGIAISDHTSLVGAAWAGYFEARRNANAVDLYTHGVEVDIVNKASTVAIGPYNMFPSGVTPCLWLTSGRPDVSGGTHASVALGIFNNGTGFNRGIVFGADSLVESGGISAAVVMPKGAQLAWEASGVGVVATVRSDATASSGNLVFFNGGLSFQIATVLFPDISTTANGANVFLDPSSRSLLMVTSSERYKANLIPMTLAEAMPILDLVPVKFHSTASADDPDHWYYGLSAEAVARSLPRFAHYRDGKPDGVQYDRLASVPMLVIVQEQQRRIAELSQEITTLRSAYERLSARG